MAEVDSIAAEDKVRTSWFDILLALVVLQSKTGRFTVAA